MGASSMRESLERFRQLAHAFHRAVERGDSNAQERILAKRRRLVDVLERGAKPSDEEERGERERILTEILELDRAAEHLLERQRKQLGAELGALDAGRRGLAAYDRRGRHSGKWIDARR